MILIAKLFSSKLSQSTAFALCFSGLNCNGLNYNGLKGKMQVHIFPCRPTGAGATVLRGSKGRTRAPRPRGRAL